MGPYGAFATDGAITVNIPADMPPDEVTGAWLRVQAEQKAAGPKELGKAADGTPILLVNGRFGPYVQRGPAVDGEKPPRASLAPGMTPDTVTLQDAEQLLALPRVLGDDGGQEVVATLGRYGPYVKRGTESRSIPAGTSVLAITLQEAVALLQAPAQRARRGVSELKVLGAAPGGENVRLMSGRFGPYVTDGTTNATVPRGRAPESLSLEEAVELLAARAARLAEEGGAPRRKGAPRKGAKSGAAKGAKKSPAAKKKPANG